MAIAHGSFKFIAGILLVASLTASAADDVVQLHTLRTHSRLTIKVDEGVETEWKDLKGGFELLLKGAVLEDLGTVESLSDSRIKSVAITEVPQGVKVVGTWNLPTGDAAYVDPRVEHFDYREKNPARYVVDFWGKGGVTVAQQRAAQKRAARESALRKSEADAKKRQERRLAAEKARADAEDAAQFCKRPLEESQDVFLAFGPVHEKFPMSKYISTTTPDSDYNYLYPKVDTKEAQHVRLALELYRQGKLALVARTLDFLEAENPSSEYRNEMQFLRANAMLKMGHIDAARRILDDLIARVPKAPVSLHAGMFLAVHAAIRNEHLNSLEHFLWLMTHHPEHRLDWVFHMGAGEALYALKQTDRAIKEYQWVIERGPDRMAKAEAGIRMGDLHLARRQYERAVAAYFQGINYFPEESKAFPTIFVNRGETLYWLGQFDRAAQAFEDFLQNYPGHPAGWRAQFRLGEIYGRKPGLEAKSRGWFYEAINHFPFSPGATLARMRLLPCGDHGGFNEASADRFFGREAVTFDGGGEVFMDRYRDFRGLAEVRTWIALGRFDKAVNVAVVELQANAQSEARYVVGGLLRLLFRKSILDMLAAGKPYDALAFFKARHEAIPTSNDPNDPVDPDYLLKLSQAASDLGLGSVGQQLVELHRKATASRAVASEKADPADLETRLKSSDQAFSEAKALWAAGPKAEGYSVKKMRELLAKVAEESEHSYSREILSGLVEESDGRFASALAHAVKAKLLLTQRDGLGHDDGLRIDAWVARLHAVAGETRTALDLMKGLEDVSRDSHKGGVAASLGLSGLPSKEQLIVEQGEILSKQGKWGEAAAAYARVAEGTSVEASPRVVFEFARALRKSGKREDQVRSVAALRRLADGKDEFWKRLAKEALADGEISSP